MSRRKKLKSCRIRELASDTLNERFSILVPARNFLASVLSEELPLLPTNIYSLMNATHSL